MEIIEGLKRIWVIQGPVGAILSYVSLAAMIVTLLALAGQALIALYTIRHHIAWFGLSPEQKKIYAERQKLQTLGERE